MNDQPAQPSASVVVVRQADDAPEVLMVLRHERTTFGASYVFPGGVLEAGDDDSVAHCAGIDVAAANRVMKLATGALAYFSAAIRELFEETGVLLARARDGRWADPARFAAERDALNREQLSWTAFLSRHELRLACGELSYFSYWVTPRGYRRRFSTRFFLAPLPPGQQASCCGGEITDVRWIAPAAALADCAENKISLPRPTVANLKWLARAGSADDMLDWGRGRAAEGVERVLPVFVGEGDRRRVVLPGEPGYPEA